MRIEFTGRQTEIPAPLKALAERKLAKLSRLLRGITLVHVVLGRDKHRQTAEVTVHSPRLDLTATEQTGDLGASLGAALDKLARRAARENGRRRERKRRPGGEGRSWSRLEPAAALPREAPRIVRSRRFVPKPMTLEEAVLEVAPGDPPVVFRDAATRRLSVLFRRKDGNLGLIETEA